MGIGGAALLRMDSTSSNNRFALRRAFARLGRQVQKWLSNEHLEWRHTRAGARASSEPRTLAARPNQGG